MALPTQPATKAQLEAAARAIIGGAGVQDGPLRGLSMEDFDRATDLANKLTASGYTGMDEDFGNEETSPEMVALAARYPDLAGGDPGDVLRSLTARQFSNIEQRRAAQEKIAASKRATFEAGLEEIKRRRYGAPTTSEQLAALSQALLSPRRQRGIAGTFANLAPVFGQMASLQTSAEEKRAEAEQRLRQQYASDTDAAMLSALEAEGAALEPLIRTYGALAKPKPLQNVGMEVINGKLVVVRAHPDTGELIKTEVGDAPVELVPVPGVTSQGQPVFRGPKGIVNAAGQPVTQFDPKETKPEKPRAPSSTEMRQIIQTEDLVNNRLAAIRSMQEALSLNQQAYDGSISGARMTLGRLFSSDDPTYVASEQLENLVRTGGLSNLKALFGANPTEGERKAAEALQAGLDKPRAVREKLLRRLLQEMQIALRDQTKRLEGLKTGQYGQYQQPSAASAPAPAKGKPRVINWGN